MTKYIEINILKLIINDFYIFHLITLNNKNYIIIARVHRTRGNLSMATTTHNTHRHCEALKKPWQSQYGVQLFIHRIFSFWFCINFL